MKSIWQAFSKKCVAAWKKMCDATIAWYKGFVENLKTLAVQIITLFEDLLGKSVKWLEVAVMQLVLAVLTAFFVAIYDSIMLGLSELKKLITGNKVSSTKKK